MPSPLGRTLNVASPDPTRYRYSVKVDVQLIQVHLSG